jgi:serine protease Do
VIALAGKGKQVRIDAKRAGADKSFTVTLGDQPAEGSPAAGTEQPESAGLFAGVGVRELDAQTRLRLQIAPHLRGVLVAGVAPESPAAEMGLQPDDVILEVNRAPTPSVAEFRKAAKQTDRRALLLVYRHGVTVFMALSK